MNQRTTAYCAFFSLVVICALTASAAGQIVKKSPALTERLGKHYPQIFEMDADGRWEVVRKEAGMELRSAEFLNDPAIQEYMELTDAQHQSIEPLKARMKHELDLMFDQIKELLNSGTLETDEYSKLLFQQKDLINNRFEAAFLNVLLPHQRQYYFKVLLWNRIRDAGLVNELVSGSLGNQLKITTEQKKLIREKAAELLPETRKEISKLEINALQRFLNVTPIEIKKYLVQIDLLKQLLEPQIDHFTIEPNHEKLFEFEEITFEYFGSDREYPFVLFNTDSKIGIQHAVKTSIRGNYTPINISFRPPYFSNPTVRLLANEKCMDRLNLASEQKAQIKKLDKELYALFKLPESDSDSQPTDTEISFSEIQQRCQAIYLRMLEQLTPQQKESFNSLQWQHRIRAQGYLLTVRNIAKWKDVEISEAELQRIKNLQHEIGAEMETHISRIASHNVEQILDLLTDQQRQEYDALVGSKPELMRPDLARQMLDFSEVSKSR